jgi:outer membrane protein OmpA-like peptidoglycan-associated protein
LSERRAAAVKRFLVEKFNLSDQNLVAAGYGEEKLKNSEDPFAAENRRVQIANFEQKAADQR